MKWLKDIFLVLAEKCNPKHAFILLFSCILLSAGYYFLDRVLTYKRNMATAKPQMEKVEMVKPISILPEYIEYKDKTTFENKAIGTK